MDIKNIISQMTLEEKVGQLIVARRPQDPAVAMEAVTKYHLGGFTLYACDFEHSTPDEIKDLLNSYKEAAKIPLFIAAAIRKENG